MREGQEEPQQTTDELLEDTVRTMADEVATAAYNEMVSRYNNHPLNIAAGRQPIRHLETLAHTRRAFLGPCGAGRSVVLL